MPTTTKLLPRRAAEELIEKMKRQADPQKAASCQRYFKEPVAFYGLDNATPKSMMKDLLKRVKGSWKLRDAVAFSRVMVRDPHIR